MFTNVSPDLLLGSNFEVLLLKYDGLLEVFVAVVYGFFYAFELVTRVLAWGKGGKHTPRADYMRVVIKSGSRYGKFSS